MTSARENCQCFLFWETSYADDIIVVSGTSKIALVALPSYRMRLFIGYYFANSKLERKM